MTSNPAPSDRACTLAESCYVIQDSPVRSPLSHLLPLTMLRTAEVELKLGKKTGDRDSFLRAHNLAVQAIEKFKQIKAASATKTTASGGWLSKGLSKMLFNSEETPLVRKSTACMWQA